MTEKVVEGSRAGGYVKMTGQERAALRRFLNNKEAIQKIDESLVDVKLAAKDLIGIARDPLLDILETTAGGALLVPSLSQDGERVFLKKTVTKTTTKLDEHLEEAVAQLRVEDVLRVCQELSDVKEKASRPPAKKAKTVHLEPGSVAPPPTPAQKRKQKQMETEVHLLACLSKAIREKVALLSTRQTVALKVCAEQPRNYVHDASKVTERFITLAEQYVAGTRAMQDIKVRKAAQVKPLTEQQKTYQQQMLGYAKKNAPLLAESSLKIPVMEESAGAVAVPDYVVLKYEGPKPKPAKLTVHGLEEVVQQVLDRMFPSPSVRSEIPLESPGKVQKLLSSPEFRANLSLALSNECKAWRQRHATLDDHVSISLERIQQS